MKRWLLYLLFLCASPVLGVPRITPVDLTKSNPLFFNRADGIYELQEGAGYLPIEAGLHEFNVTTPYGPGLKMTTLPLQLQFLQPCSKTSHCLDSQSACLEVQNKSVCVPYHNSEIYNSNCCSRQMFESINASEIEILAMESRCGGHYSHDLHCQLTRNPWVLDNEIQNYISDLFLNRPFGVGQGVEAWVKFSDDRKNGGSFGFGLWNTEITGSMETAWFMHQYDEEYPLNGMYVMQLTPGVLPTLQEIQDPTDQWHHYRIEWHTDRLIFKMDGKVVFETTSLPKSQMALHVWHDNSVFTLSPLGAQHQTVYFDAPKTTTISSLHFLEF